MTPALHPTHERTFSSSALPGAPAAAPPRARQGFGQRRMCVTLAGRINAELLAFLKR